MINYASFNHFYIAVDSFDFPVDAVSIVVDRIKEGTCHKSEQYRLNPI